MLIDDDYSCNILITMHVFIRKIKYKKIIIDLCIKRVYHI